MAVYFFDTSALVKRYYEEQGTEAVDEIVEREDSEVLVSSLAIIETLSAFRRKYNADEITEAEMNALLAAFFREALDDFLVVPVEESMLQFSFDLVLEDDLRTLDSLQLAAALSIEPEIDEMTFVCADSELVEVAGSRGLDAVNPR